MPILEADVLGVLRDPLLHSIRFSVGPINVNAEEYDDVGDYIETGAITVKPGNESASKYYAQTNTLVTRAGDPPMDSDARTNMLHECTHAIADINKVKVTRLTDEVAAYLAQITYLLLVDPSPVVLRGLPMTTVMLQGMDMVKKYHLGEPAGHGAQILQSDITEYSNVIHTVSDYSYNPKEQSVADGVSLSDKQAEAFLRLQLKRMMTQLGDDLMRRDIDEMLTTKFSYSAHENWVTNDSELLALFQSYGSGGTAQKNAALKKLIHIFLTIDQPSASRYLPRVSTLKKGDNVSQLFQTIFPAAAKQALTSALQLSR